MPTGADGFAFVIQNQSDTAIGAGLGQLGYAKTRPLKTPVVPGITKSLAVEFDTYSNPELLDPNNNHLSIHTKDLEENDADEAASIENARYNFPPGFLQSDAERLVRIEYEGTLMKIFVDDMTTPVSQTVIAFENIIGKDETHAYIGFTGGVGVLRENHEILNWSFVPKVSEIYDLGTAPNADESGPYTVTTAEYHPGADTVTNHQLELFTDTAVIPDRNTELWARYYFPSNISNTSNLPIVILLHGNHQTCGTGSNPRRDDNQNYTNSGSCPANYVVVPSHRGYEYLAKKLSSWGYIVVSINANLGINGTIDVSVPYLRSNNLSHPEYEDDPEITLARGRLVLRHLQRLSEWNAGVKEFIRKPPFINRPSLRKNYKGWVGIQITTGAEPVKVTSLGRRYIFGNRENHLIRIIKPGTELPIAEVNVSMSDWNDGQFRYKDLATPVILEPNTVYYIASDERRRTDNWAGNLTTLEINDVATVNNAVESKGGFGTVNWTSKGTPGQGYGIVDFIYEKDSSTPFGNINLKGKIDFGNVGLMGHSRGGEGMRAAYNLYKDTDSPWQDKSSRIRQILNVKGIFEFSGTDRSFFVPNKRIVNADGTAWVTVLPACDTDLFNLEGVQSFDRMFQSSVAENPAKLKATYFVYRTNHNFFNTQWQQSDALGCIGEDNTTLFNDVGVLDPVIYGDSSYGSVSQTKIGLSAFLSFFRGNVGESANQNFNQNFDPQYLLPEILSPRPKIKRGYIGSPNQNFSKKLNDVNFSQNTNLCSPPDSIICSVNNTNILEVISKKVQLNRYNSPTTDVLNHDLDFTAASLSWNSPAPNRYIQINSSVGEVINLTQYQTLDFRVSRRRSDTASTPLELNQLNTTPTTNFLIQLVMNNGAISKPVNLNKYLLLDGPVGTQDTPPTSLDPRKGEYHPILQTVRVPLSDIQGTDLTQIKGIRLVFTDTSKGAIFLSNFRFSR